MKHMPVIFLFSAACGFLLSVWNFDYNSFVQKKET